MQYQGFRAEFRATYELKTKVALNVARNRGVSISLTKKYGGRMVIRTLPTSLAWLEVWSYPVELDPSMMKEQGKNRLLLTDDQHRLLSEKGKSLDLKE